jgi:hypothetical protein
MYEEESLYPGAIERRKARDAASIELLRVLHARHREGKMRYPEGLGYLSLRRRFPVEAAALDAEARRAGEATPEASTAAPPDGTR